MQQEKHEFAGLGPKPPRSFRQPIDQADGPPPAGVRREVITLAEGDVTISFPTQLSAESYQDLADHLAIFLRKAKRQSDIEAERRRIDRDDVPE